MAIRPVSVASHARPITVQERAKLYAFMHSSIPRQLFFQQQINMQEYAWKQAKMRASLPVQILGACTALVPVHLPGIAHDFFRAQAAKRSSDDDMTVCDFGDRLSDDQVENIDRQIVESAMDEAAIVMGDLPLLPEGSSSLFEPMVLPQDNLPLDPFTQVLEAMGLGSLAQEPTSSDRVTVVEDGEEVEADASADLDEDEDMGLDETAEEPSLWSTIANILYTPIDWIAQLLNALRKCLGLA